MLCPSLGHHPSTDCLGEPFIVHYSHSRLWPRCRYFIRIKVYVDTQKSFKSVFLRPTARRVSKQNANENCDFTMAEMMEQHAHQDGDENTNVLNMSGAFEIEKLTVRLVVSR